jgi:hypothetical protein
VNPILVARLGSIARKVWPYVAIVAAIGLALLVAYCSGGTGEKNKQLEREVEVQQDIGAANTNASTARVEDAVRTTQEERELDAALKAVVGPDERRALRGCVILRQQGRDTSAIAACRGPESR